MALQVLNMLPHGGLPGLSGIPGAPIPGLLRPRRRLRVLEPEPTQVVISKDQLDSFRTSCNPQTACPLFQNVPPEIRNRIFQHALLSYEDLSAVYPNDAHYSRPGFRYASHIDARLLCTCKLIYLETRFLPVMADEHVFWCERPPPNLRLASNPQQYFARFSKEHRDHVEKVHFFTQQWYLEGRFPQQCLLESMRPRVLHITLRHGDWWYWEDNNPLDLKPGWAANLKNIERLQELVLELETMERDKAQIYAIAERVKKEKIPLSGGRVLSAADVPLVKRDWMGPAKLGDRLYNKEKNAWKQITQDDQSPDPGMKYCIVVIRWVARISKAQES